MTRILALLGAATIVAGCGGDDGGGGTTEVDCLDCPELCVTYANGDDFDAWFNVCEPFPAACDPAAACDDTACVGAMYDVCDEGYFGQANSCSGGATIVTCAVDTSS